VVVALSAALPSALAATSPRVEPTVGESNGVGSGSLKTDPGNAVAGRIIFINFCGKCHTMSAAGTSGTLGPNLDQDKVNFTRVVTAVLEGIGGVQAEYKLMRSCSASLGPRCVTFTQLYDVAKFVIVDS